MTQSATGTARPRHTLGRLMRELRRNAGFSLRTAAEKITLSPATLSRVENGLTSIRTIYVEPVCRAYGVEDPALIAELTELARETKGGNDSNNWMQSYADVVSENFRTYIGLEEAAASFAWYEPEFVPGLLQTREYARSVMAIERLAGGELAPDAVERRIDVRIARQEILTRDQDPPTLRCIVGETALTRPLADAETMAAQLEHLLNSVERTNIDIRVMPTDRVHGGLTTGQFTLLDFLQHETDLLSDPPIVYVDGFLGFFVTDKADEVQRHKKAWADMWEDKALGKTQTAAFIEQRLRELRLP